MKEFLVKVFVREAPDDGKLTDPVNYRLVSTDTVQAWQPKNGVETAATRFNASVSDSKQRIKIGDLVVIGGTAFEFRIMGWVERSDPEFIGALGIQGTGWEARWQRRLGKWKVQWERAKLEFKSK